MHDFLSTTHAAKISLYVIIYYIFISVSLYYISVMLSHYFIFYSRHLYLYLCIFILYLCHLVLVFYMFVPSDMSESVWNSCSWYNKKNISAHHICSWSINNDDDDDSTQPSSLGLYLVAVYVYKKVKIKSIDFFPTPFFFGVLFFTTFFLSARITRDSVRTLLSCRYCRRIFMREKISL